MPETSSLDEGNRGFKSNPLNCFRDKKEKKLREKQAQKHPRLEEPRRVPKGRLSHVALFPFESSHFETMCSLEFQMAKLRNQTIKQKVLVSTMIILGSSGREYGTASFLTKVAEKPRTDLSQMAIEMGFSGFRSSFPHLQMWL